MIETGLLWVRVPPPEIYVRAHVTDLTARTPPPVVNLYVRPPPNTIYVTEK